MPVGAMDKLLEKHPFLNGTDWSTFPEEVQNYLKHLYLTYNGTLNSTRGLQQDSLSSAYWVKIHPIVMATLVTIATLFGIIGNVMVCYSVVRSRDVKTGSSVLLVNLCVASLIFLTVCAPILIFHDLLYFDWVFGLFMCKLVPYVMHVTLYVITYTLATISLYQHVAVSYPRRFYVMCSRQRTCMIIVTIWVTFLVLNVPHLVGYELEGRNGSVQCYHKDIVQDQIKAKVWCALYFTFFLCLPLTLMTFVTCHTLYRVTRSSLPADYQRILHMTSQNPAHTSKHTFISLITLILFSVCWIPFQIMIMLGTFHSLQHWTPAHTIFLDVGMCLAYMNPSVNPYIYMFLHPDTRQAVLVHVCRARDPGVLVSTAKPNGHCQEELSAEEETQGTSDNCSTDI